MHESAIASSLLRIVEEEARKFTQGKEPKITEVILDIGVLAGIEARTLSACFELMAEDTIASGAPLLIQVVAMKGFCPDCQQPVETLTRHFSCPLCGCTKVEWQGGNEMVISSVKIADD